jgi:hypothetical protein
VKRDEKDDKIIGNAIAALTADGPEMGVALERCKLLYTGLLITAMQKCDNDDSKIQLIECFVGNSKQVLTILERESKKDTKD